MIIIKKRVSFDYLGDEYKDAYLVFKSIPGVDFDDIQEKLKGFEGKDKGSIGFIVSILKQYFLSGSFPDIPEVRAVDLDGLDAESIIKCFRTFTGQEIDPKVETPSTTPLPTTSST